MTVRAGRLVNMNDQTSRIESTLNAEAKPKVVHLLRLWTFVLRSAKAMSLLFLGLMTLLSLLRPIAALLWGWGMEERLGPLCRIFVSNGN